MITVTTTTQMIFKNSEQYNSFIETDESAKILGFTKEIEESRASGMPYIFKTDRPKYGAVAVSTICYSEVKSDE
jgi:hypothetical protein